MAASLGDWTPFPHPRVLVPRPGGVPAGTTPRAVQDRALPAQSFVLDLSDDGIAVAYADDAGRRYAEATLAQLREAFGAELPGLHLEDGPDFPIRGYMLDVSRDRVPTRETLDRIVGLMARARLNHLELYVEHTFAYRDHEEVWRDASPLTVDDLAWLHARCGEAGIELVANQNCFGHMERWLRHDRYRWRAETPDGYEFLPGVRRPPSTLAPTPENAEFVLGLLAELLPHFASRQVNIGCDEPFELGQGASAAEVAARGKAAVYLDHVRRIADPLVADGHDVLLWADILRQEPHLRDALSAGVTPIAWCYEAPGLDAAALPAAVVDLLGRIGIDLSAHEGFGPNTAPLVDAGIPFWVAPGTSSWCSLVGRIDNALGNLVDAAEVGCAQRSAGYLITDWGDDGHLQPPSVSFGPLLYGGAVAWGLDANRDLDVAALLDEHAFVDETRTLGAAVVELGRLWGQTGLHPFNGSPLHTALLGTIGLATGTVDADAVRDVVGRIDAAVAAIAASRPRAADGALVRHELAVAASLARNGAQRLLAQAGVDPSADLDAERVAIAEELRIAWLARARPGGLPDALARLGVPS